MLQTWLELMTHPSGQRQTNPMSPFGDVGLIYPVNDTVEYTRPTLRRSGLLYSTFAIQPLLVIISLVLVACWLDSTPLDKDFGFVSILSGIDRESLDIVNGASLSGKLATKIRLVMHPIRNNQGDTIRYRVMPSSSSTTRRVRNRKPALNTIYH